jgi:hypothetical protein
VRFRHLDSDFSRAARQQLFLREVGRQIQAGVTDVAALPDLVDAMAQATTSDLASVSETLTLAHQLRSTAPDRVNRVVLEGAPAMLGGVSYVVASPAQRRRALSRWARPGRRIRLQQRRASAQKRSAGRRRRTRVALVPDGGAGRRMARSLDDVSACAPTGLPAGYRWGPQQPARSYTLADHPAGAMWATAGSGRSVLFMHTTWTSPPVLDRPSESIRLAGRNVQLFYESGRLRMVAWRDGEDPELDHEHAAQRAARPGARRARAVVPAVTLGAAPAAHERHQRDDRQDGDALRPGVEALEGDRARHEGECGHEDREGDEAQHEAVGHGTGAPARMDHHATASAPAAARTRSVSSPFGPWHSTRSSSDGEAITIFVPLKTGSPETSTASRSHRASSLTARGLRPVDDLGSASA